MNAFKRNFHEELVFRFSRSSGPGGQNVNKVNTRVEALLHINSSKHLTIDEKERIIQKLGSKINVEGYLLVSSQATRSQIQNRQNAVLKLHLLIEQALLRAKRRTPTKPSRSSKLRRLEHKKQHAQKKRNRKNLDF